MALLPPGVAPMEESIGGPYAPKDYVEHTKIALAENWLAEAEVMDLITCVPTEIMRRIIFKYSGLDSSIFLTLRKQIQLMDTVMSQLVTPQGNLKPVPEGIDISLKDAMSLSLNVTRLITKDLPKVYNLERVSKMEQAMGDIMDKHFTAEQQEEVLDRLQKALEKGD